MKFAPEKPKFGTMRQSSHFDHGQQRRHHSKSLLLDENPLVLQNETSFLYKIFSIGFLMSFIAHGVFWNKQFLSLNYHIPTRGSICRYFQ